MQLQFMCEIRHLFTGQVETLTMEQAEMKYGINNILIWKFDPQSELNFWCWQQLKITAEYFEKCTGMKPEQDDLERCNCPVVGTIGHFSCGWNHITNLPAFMNQIK